LTRWRVACDHCDAAWTIGEADGGTHAWCESCQDERWVPGERVASAACEVCGAALTFGAPRFVELWGRLQNVAAVLAAIDGDPVPLGRLLPERPRFLTDLDPPNPTRADDDDTRAALDALAFGDFTRARRLLETIVARPRVSPHAWRGLAIAAERTGALDVAERAYDHVLAEVEDRASRLARGALRARRGDVAGARADSERAGDAREARWNRGALMALDAVSAADDTPLRERLAAARAEAGPPSPFWSEPTIGRLVFGWVVERVRARSPRLDPADVEHLEAAAAELEFETFWDRALVIHGWALLGQRTRAAENGLPVVVDLLAKLAREPALRGAALRDVAAAVTISVDDAHVPDARARFDALLRRDDLRRYRIPCACCGRGSVGVEGVDEEAGSA
jgi:hypothetical protein